ncbi:DNA replication licensing factor MCM4 (Minichromosome maintenance protein 4) (AtMCM4) [Durusdinium trenchii]|uniref:DNA helicase n=1 Tax=Durusdinium trenchii TaxID=1381693 RepID=A0ABP0K6E3_9DINO
MSDAGDLDSVMDEERRSSAEEESSEEESSGSDGEGGFATSRLAPPGQTFVESAPWGDDESESDEESDDAEDQTAKQPKEKKAKPSAPRTLDDVFGGEDFGSPFARRARALANVPRGDLGPGRKEVLQPKPKTPQRRPSNAAATSDGTPPRQQEQVQTLAATPQRVVAPTPQRSTGTMDMHDTLAYDDDDDDDEMVQRSSDNDHDMDEGYPAAQNVDGSLVDVGPMVGAGGSGGGGDPGGNDDDDEDEDARGGDDHGNGNAGGGGGNNNNNDEDDNGSAQNDRDLVNQGFIYGTNLSIDESLAFFKSFLCEFKLPGQNEAHFTRELRNMEVSGALNVEIDCKFLEDHSDQSRQLYRQLVKYPQETIAIFDLGLHEVFGEIHGEEALRDLETTGKRIQVRTYNLHRISRMRGLDPENIDEMVALRGMIIRVSPIIPDLKQAFFRCTLCNFEIAVLIDQGVIAEPKKCDGCNTRSVMTMIHNRSIFTDKQMIKLQEAPENIPEGETPHTISVYAYDNLVDVAKPGDRVEVTGVYRAVATRRHPARRTLHSIYKTYVDVLHFQKIDKGANAMMGRNRHVAVVDGPEVADPDTAHLAGAPGTSGLANQVGDEQQQEEQVLTAEEQLEEFREMSQDPDLYDKLAHSVAPSIWELDDIKKGVLLLLFGGTNKEVEQQVGATTKSTHRMRSRGEINILLCGDPGTSKSQILGYVHKLAPRGIYTSGKGSSAVGLTAYISRDPDTKELILESGALVLSDRGVCCIDEFDKMSDTTRAILHECMEQQTISIAKAGIIATLNARTSILASANPKESRYNPRMSMTQNIDLVPTLLSRFDLIYLVLDKPDRVTDRRLARHLVKLYFRDPGTQRTTIDQKKLRKYIAYCRNNVFPVIGQAAVRRLVQGYVDMRQLGAMGGKKTVSATPRQLESLVRLAEAHAKIRMATEVSESDVDEAIRLMHVATQKSAMDPRTGTIDMDVITTGRSVEERERTEQFAQELLGILQKHYPGRSAKVKRLHTDLKNLTGDETILEDDVKAAIVDLASKKSVFYNKMNGDVRELSATA